MTFSTGPEKPRSEEYIDIFTRRGHDYDLGMHQYPQARAQEFETAIAALELGEGDALLDVPAGGGYLKSFLPQDKDLTVVELDPATNFARASTREDGQGAGAIVLNALVSRLDAMPIRESSFDALVSVAGLHHAGDLQRIFREWRRVLKPSGRLVIMEVDQGSRVDTFLNEFVDTHSSHGHRGDFVTEAFRRRLVEAGFEIDKDQLQQYHWDFPSRAAMVEFTRLIFGLDLADDKTILQGVADTLGIAGSRAGCSMNWELRLLGAC